MTINYNSFSDEDGSTYDFENYNPKTLRSMEDKFERIINRSGRYSLYDDMVSNEPIVGAANNLIESFVCSEEFRNKPSDMSEEAKYYSDLMWDMLNDTEKPFVDSIKDWLTFLHYGFSISEIVLKKRLGYHPENPKINSKFNDGLIGVRKFAPRPQKTIEKWNYDNFSRIESVEQQNPTSYEQVSIDYNRLLHFKIKSYNDNPEGTSLYRNIAQTYYDKQKIKRTQRIRFERGFDGIPVIELPAEWCNSSDTKHSGIRKWAENTVKNLRQGQDQGIVLPRMIGKDLKPLITFSIISGDTPVGQNPEEMLERCDREMTTSLLSDFFLSGKTASVSGALGQIKVEVFATFVSMFLNTIVNEINNKLYPLIFEINGFDKKYMPTLTHSNLIKLNMTSIMLFLQSLKASKAFKVNWERDNALGKLVFGNAMPEISKEEWTRMQDMEEVNTNTSLNAPQDMPVADLFDDNKEK